MEEVNGLPSVCGSVTKRKNSNNKQREERGDGLKVLQKRNGK
jgi:hypothetical protein